MKIMQICFTPIVNSTGGAEKVYCNMANHFIKKHDVINICCDDVDGVPYYPLDNKNKFYNIGHRLLKTYPLKIKIANEFIRLAKKIGMRKEYPKEKYIRTLVRESLKRLVQRHVPDKIICYELRSMVLLDEIEYDLKKVIVMFHNNARIIYEGLDNKQYNLLKEVNIIQVLLESDKNFLNSKGFTNVVCIGNIVPTVDYNIKQEKEKLIVTVGRLDRKQKRQHLLIEAFSKIAHKYPDWKVLIYGGDSTPLNYKEYLKKLIDEKQIENQVKLMGKESNIIDILKKGSIFAFPSSYEGFGLALAEAMSVGLPCIGFSNAPGVNELIINNYNGFLVDNINDFADKLEMLVINRDLCDFLGNNAVQSIQIYSEEKIFEKWDQIIIN